MTKQSWLLNLALMVLTFAMVSCFNKKEETAPEAAPEATTETVGEETPAAEEPAAAIVEETPATGESMDAAPPAEAPAEAAPAEAAPTEAAPDQTNNNTQSGSQTGVASNGTNNNSEDCLNKKKDAVNPSLENKKNPSDIDLNSPNTGCSL
jgi:hypothetical protein